MSDKEELKPDCYGRRQEDGSFKFPIFDEPMTPDDEGLKLLTTEQYSSLMARIDLTGEIIEVLESCLDNTTKLYGVAKTAGFRDDLMEQRSRIESLLSLLEPKALSKQTTEEGE